jgi:hypothetical protein
MVLRLTPRSPWRPGFFVTIAREMRERHHFSAMRSIVTGDAQGIITNLTPASGHQDHTASPSAIGALRLAHRRVHRIPRPTFVTIAKRPSDECGTASLIELILLRGEVKSFCSEGWTPNEPDSLDGQINKRP